MPFREESCRSSCIYSGPLHSHSHDAVSQHPSTRAGAESIQLIYSGRALQALSDLARHFGVTPFFGGSFTPVLKCTQNSLQKKCTYVYTHTHIGIRIHTSPHEYTCSSTTLSKHADEQLLRLTIYAQICIHIHVHR